MNHLPEVASLGSTLRLLIPPLLACAADVSLTLAGQPAGCWRGDRSQVMEFNPAARLLLIGHPMLFVVAGLLTSAAVVVVVLRCNRRLAGGVSLLVTLGHTIAAGAWLAKQGPLGWCAAAVLLLLAKWACSPPRSEPISVPTD